MSGIERKTSKHVGIKMKVFVTFAAICGFAIATASVAHLRYSEDHPSVVCAEAGRGQVTRRVLILGESWASDGRLLPDLPNVISLRTDQRVRACTIGYSGRNSLKVFSNFRTDLARRALRGNVDNVVILLGVNDQIQHMRAEHSANNIVSIASLFPQSNVQVVSAPPVSDDPPLPLVFRTKNLVAHFFNGEVNADYVEALKKRIGPERLISFTDFSLGYPRDRRKFTNDGIHLTPAAFHEYGKFIGRRVNLDPIEGALNVRKPHHL